MICTNGSAGAIVCAQRLARRRFLQVGDQHRAGRMRDADGGWACGDHGLRRHAAGPEHRQLVRPDVGRDRRNRAGRCRRCRSPPGMPTCTGAPCTAGKREVIWIGADRVGRHHRPHRDHQRPVESPAGVVASWCGTSAHCGPARRAAAGRRPRSAPPRTRTSSRSRRRRDRRASSARCRSARRPARRRARRDSAAHRCGCRGRRRVRQRRIARLRHASSGQGFGLRWQKRRKSSAWSARQDGDVALDVAGRQAGGGQPMLAAADAQPRCLTGPGRTNRSVHALFPGSALRPQFTHARGVLSNFQIV